MMTEGSGVYVVGVGLTDFVFPGTETEDFPDFSVKAINLALEDAKLSYEDVGAAVCGYVYGDSTSGHAVCYRAGLTGIPILNINSNCSTGSSTIFTAKMMVESGTADCVLACGFEKTPGGLDSFFKDREHPAQRHLNAMKEAGIPEKRFLEGVTTELTEQVLKVYAHSANMSMKLNGYTKEQFAIVSAKNHFHSQYNPKAMIKKPMTPDQVLKSRPLFPPLTTAMSAPLASGASAAVLCNRQFLEKHKLWENAIEIVSQSMTSDTMETFKPSSSSDPTKNLCGFDLSARAAQNVWRKSGMAPEDVQVFEIHDAFSSNEMATYEALGMAKEGCAGKLVDSGEYLENRNGGKLFHFGEKKWVVNPSGGLESCGHAVGATGLRQLHEISLQLRSLAGKRQVDDATLALQHNYGWSSCCVVTLYRKPSFSSSSSSSKL